MVRRLLLMRRLLGFLVLIVVQLLFGVVKSVGYSAECISVPSVGLWVLDCLATAAVMFVSVP